jgi:1,4-dihydroxy-2-naphthoate octaprenyltransferase
VALLAAAFLLVAVLALAGRPAAIAGVVGVVLASPAERAVRKGASGRDLVPVLGATGRVQLMTGIVTAVGIALSA